MVKKWLLVGAVVFGSLGLFALQLFGPNSSGVVGPTTTRIMGPLAADGLPNYALAMVQEQREGVTRANNGARQFWEAMGPLTMSAEEYRLLCADIDIRPDALPTHLVDVAGADTQRRIKAWLESGRLAPGGDAAASDAAAKDAAVWPGEEQAVDWDAAAADVLESARTAAWTAEEIPPLAEWLAENGAALDRLVEGSSKSRFYCLPPNVLANPNTPLIEVMLPQCDAARAAIRSLLARAGFRMGRKKYAEAWEDCLATWRLGAQAASGPTIVERLVGIAIRKTAADFTMSLLDCDGLPEPLVRQILDDLNAQPPVVPMAGTFDHAERYMYLDIVLRSLTGRLGGPVEGLVDAIDTTAGLFAFDVNVPLEEGNRMYDQLVAAASISDRRARWAALERFEAELSGVQGRIKEGLFKSLFSRRKRSEVMSDVFVSQMFPALTAAIRAEERDEATLALTKIGAALAISRVRHGAYPEALAELVPDVLATLPADRFGLGPPKYQRRGDGYVLYSVFENGLDDGGTDYAGKIVKGEWVPEEQRLGRNDDSDLVIRVPRPRRPIAEIVTGYWPVYGGIESADAVE